MQLVIICMGVSRNLKQERPTTNLFLNNNVVQYFQMVLCLRIDCPYLVPESQQQMKKWKL